MEKIGKRQEDNTGIGMKEEKEWFLGGPTNFCGVGVKKMGENQ